MNRLPPAGPVAHDEEGDPLPLPETGSDLADLIQLLEYARTKDFQVGPMVVVGKIRLQVADIRQLRKLGVDRPKAEPEPSIGEMVGVPDYNPGE